MSESKKKATPAEPAPTPVASTSNPNAKLVIAALLFGSALGWFTRGANLKREPDEAAKPVASAASSSGASVCDDWAGEVCRRLGDTTEGCSQAKEAAGVMPNAACAVAKNDIKGTVAKLKSVRSACDSLVEKICADVGDKTETCTMVREKTPSFPAERCKGMLEHYDEVIAELKSVEQEKAPLPDDLARRQAAGDAPSFGPKDAKLTLVEYSDFECPYCGRAAEVITKVKEKYGTKVRFVFRQFPLPMHSHADLAAQASLAANAQGKFWAFHDLLFQNQRDLERPSLEKFAQKAGLDMAKFKKALDDHTYADAVKADVKLGTEASVGGTPTMFLGAERVENGLDVDVLSAEIDRRLAAQP